MKAVTPLLNANVNVNTNSHPVTLNLTNRCVCVLPNIIGIRQTVQMLLRYQNCYGRTDGPPFAYGEGIIILELYTEGSNYHSDGSVIISLWVNRSSYHQFSTCSCPKICPNSRQNTNVPQLYSSSHCRNGHIYSGS